MRGGKVRYLAGVPERDQGMRYCLQCGRCRSFMVFHGCDMLGSVSIERFKVLSLLNSCYGKCM